VILNPAILSGKTAKAPEARLSESKMTSGSLKVLVQHGFGNFYKTPMLAPFT